MNINKTKIQWTEYTWNPFQGCKKVSEGCKHCYMYRTKDRYGKDPTIVVKSSSTTFTKPLKIYEPSLIFTCSWSDFFTSEADMWRKECWDIIKRTPQHIYQILTKRPDRILECLPDDWGEGYPNVWLGVTIEMEKYNYRWEQLKQVPTMLRFVSFEPLLENISELPDAPDWVIIGGESGYNKGNYRYRLCRLEWILNIVNHFKERTSCTPVFIKQLGTYLAKELNLKDNHGGDMSEFPDDFKIREMPHLNEIEKVEQNL
jgi:protein gp37